MEEEKKDNSQENTQHKCHGEHKHGDGEHHCCHNGDHSYEHCDCKKECHKHEDTNEKVKQLKTELEMASKLANEYNSKAAQYLSTATYYKNQLDETKKDFDRFKERNKNIEKEAKVKASETMVKALLPIIDDFDSAITNLSPEVMRGFVMIYSSLTNILKELGATEIVCKNETLDPEKHNCIDTEPTDNAELDGKIASVYKKGYMFAESNTVIRPATVSVYKVDL